MRIGFTSSMIVSPWGGSEELWCGAAACLASQGLTIAAHVPRWPIPVPQIKKLQALGGQIHWRWAPRLPHRVLRRFGLLRETEYRWLDRFRPDLVVCSLGCQAYGLETALACQRRDIPYALIVQAASDQFWPEQAEPFAACYERAAACYFVSENNRRLVERQVGGPLANARLVRNPFNVGYEACPPWPGEGGEWRLACVGRLCAAAKGQDLIFEVLRQDKWRHRNLSVSLYGTGPDEGTLRKLARSYGLSQVRFCGFSSDIEKVWATHHALLLPSRYEGLPLAVVEALLCGRTCIVTNVAGNAELLQDNETGFVAAAPQVELLDEALERAWARRQEWRQMGRLAAEGVRKQVPADPAAEFAKELVILGRGFTRRNGVAPPRAPVRALMHTPADAV